MTNALLVLSLLPSLGLGARSPAHAQARPASAADQGRWPGDEVFGARAPAAKGFWAARRATAASSAAEKAIFSVSLADARADGRRMHAFFKAHPSTASSGPDFQHALFDLMGTMPDNPLQALVYRATSQQVNADGQVSARWQPYAAACEHGAPLAERDRLFLAAHTADLQEVLQSETFQRLFPLATRAYQDVVTAYYKTMMLAELQLAHHDRLPLQDPGAEPSAPGSLARAVVAGGPTDIARAIFGNAVKKGGGFEVTARGALNVLLPVNEVGRRFYGAGFSLFKAQKPVLKAKLASLVGAKTQL